MYALYIKKRLEIVTVAKDESTKYWAEAVNTYVEYSSSINRKQEAP